MMSSLYYLDRNGSLSSPSPDSTHCNIQAHILPSILLMKQRRILEGCNHVIFRITNLRVQVTSEVIKVQPLSNAYSASSMTTTANRVPGFTGKTGNLPTFFFLKYPQSSRSQRNLYVTLGLKPIGNKYPEVLKQ